MYRHKEVAFLKQVIDRVLPQDAKHPILRSVISQVNLFCIMIDVDEKNVAKLRGALDFIRDNWEKDVQPPPV